MQRTIYIELDNTVGAIRVKRPNQYDKTRLEAILEIVPKAVAIERDALTLEKTELMPVTPPRDWNLTQTKALKEF